MSECVHSRWAIIDGIVRRFGWSVQALDLKTKTFELVGGANYSFNSGVGATTAYLLQGIHLYVIRILPFAPVFGSIYGRFNSWSRYDNVTGVLYNIIAGDGSVHYPVDSLQLARWYFDFATKISNAFRESIDVINRTLSFTNTSCGQHSDDIVTSSYVVDG